MTCGVYELLDYEFIELHLEQLVFFLIFLAQIHLLHKMSKDDIFIVSSPNILSLHTIVCTDEPHQFQKYFLLNSITQELHHFIVKYYDIDYTNPTEILRMKPTRKTNYLSHATINSTMPFISVIFSVNNGYCNQRMCKW